MSSKISFPMQSLMKEATKQPVREYGNAQQLKSLAKRGLMQKDRGFWVLTDAGIAEVGADKNQVALAYASYWLRNLGFQIRHNVQMVNWRFNDGEPYLRTEYMQRSFADNVTAVHDFQMRAIELARAEWRAGIAVAEIGLVG